MATWMTACYDTPFIEQSELPLASTGDGTSFPVIWRKDYGDTSTNQITRFLWQCSEITLTASGSFSLMFTDPLGVNPPELHSFTFSANFLYGRFNIPSTGDASQLEVGGSIYTDLNTASGGTEVGAPTLISGSLPVTPSSITTSWGDTGTVNSGASFDMFQDLIPIQGTLKPDGLNWDKYTRSLRISMNFGAVTTNGGGATSDGGLVSVLTDISLATGYSALGTSASIFHGSGALYWKESGPSSNTISVPSCAVSTTLELAGPPPI